MMNKRFLLLAVLCWSAALLAQVELSGTIDFAVTKAGKDSKFLTNEVANEFRNPHLAIHQLNFFVFGQINDQFMVNARVQFDTWGTGRLNQPRITLANLTWEPMDSPISLAIGRFVSPFGLYPKRTLAADNLFTHAPLAYGYFINISDKRGFWPKAGNSGTYGPDDVGLTTVYFGGYNTGALFNWTIIPEALNVEVALTNAAVASQADYTNMNNFGAIMRLGFQPVIYWQQGISISHGSFMQRDGINSLYGGLEDFSQTVFGTDWVLAHSYFEFSGEAIYSLWRVPLFANGDFGKSAPGILQEYKLTNYGAYADLKFEPPFLTGAYLAFRYDILRFSDAEDIREVNGKDFNPWDNDVTRYSIAAGYKFARDILLKIAYTDQKTENLNPDPENEVIRAMLTVSF